MKIEVTTKFDIGQKVYFFADPEQDKFVLDEEQEMQGEISAIKLFKTKNEEGNLFYEIRSVLTYHHVPENKISLTASKETTAIHNLFDNMEVLDDYGKQEFMRTFYKLRNDSIKRKSVVKN